MFRVSSLHNSSDTSKLVVSGLFEGGESDRAMIFLCKLPKVSAWPRNGESDYGDSKNGDSQVDFYICIGFTGKVGIMAES
ncbi:hypothetical protein F2Q69_00050394 [Brassica cretica]|uniref:Uncharacterized protein n=1 Tax=Brassica cretica TaxID=69181 RepID=A0A8S9PVC2_BRACR|nr:hypothetical protein F2Q69_00050394 [Brassica cretica]